jgi:hypothetical protein
VRGELVYTQLRKPETTHTEDKSRHDFQGMCEGLFRGFNQTLLCMGQAALGKTTRLFGRFAWPASRMTGPCCILTSIIRRILAAANSEPGTFHVALSCWEVVSDQVLPDCPTWKTCPKQKKGQKIQYDTYKHRAYT